MSSATPTDSPPDAAIVYLSISPAAVDVCASVVHHSFNNFNRTVNLPAESASIAGSRELVVSRLSRPTTFHLMAVKPTADSVVEHYVEGVGEVVGVVMMDLADEAAGLAPLVVNTLAQSRGVGRELMLRCIGEADRRGVKSIRLIAIVANVASFSLYHSLGYRACEYAVAVQSHFTEAHHKQLAHDMLAAGINIRPMQREDLAACNQLHVATMCVSRLAGITHSFDSQPSQREQPISATAHSGSPGPTTGCWVAVGSGGALVGYCTGWIKNSH